MFPGALGDLLCCWPAIDALRARAALTLATRIRVDRLLPDASLAHWSVDRREIAELFGAGPLSPQARELFANFDAIDSFTGHGDPQVASRLAEAASDTVRVHPFRAMRVGESAGQYYARRLGVPLVYRRLDVQPDAVAWADALWRRAGLGARTLAIHPGSGSPLKNWQGMEAVAAAWRYAGGQIVALHGPVEIEHRTRLASVDASTDDEPLDHVAAVIARAQYYLGNDSGISHLAGLVGARALVLFGDSDPRIWAPSGDRVHVIRGIAHCPHGEIGLCVHRLPVEDVLAALP